MLLVLLLLLKLLVYGRIVCHRTCCHGLCSYLRYRDTSVLLRESWNEIRRYWLHRNDHCCRHLSSCHTLFATICSDRTTTNRPRGTIRILLLFLGFAIIDLVSAQLNGEIKHVAVFR
uniref:Putative secreted protein n=1 Tax=Anopheles darlingi TaxID=43151 RepID=A0A2M4D6B5_ANODA